MKRYRRVVPVIAVVLLLMQGAFAGQLDDFEEKASKKKSEPKPKSERKSRSSDRGSYSTFGSGSYSSARGGDGFLHSIWFWMLGSPFAYRHYDASEAMMGSDEAGWSSGAAGPMFEHDSGSPVLPWLRADYNHQYINTDLAADDVRVEAGYRMLAFHGRHTRYTESHPTDHLDISQFYGVFRLGNTDVDDFGGLYGWEMGMGLGGVQQRGNDKHSSFAFTFPVKLYPTEWLGFEFRPAWYRPQQRTIGDYDFSVNGGWRFVQLRAGYRWLYMQGEGHLFNGPYAGVSLSF
jgi:hypothetical protein